MTDVEIVDARGLSCPQPAFMTQKAVKKVGTGRIEVLVDNETSRVNVGRIAQRAGWTVDVQDEEDGVSRLVLVK